MALPKLQEGKGTTAWSDAKAVIAWFNAMMSDADKKQLKKDTCSKESKLVVERVHTLVVEKLRDIFEKAGAPLDSDKKLTSKGKHLPSTFVRCRKEQLKKLAKEAGTVVISDNLVGLETFPSFRKEHYLRLFGEMDDVGEEPSSSSQDPKRRRIE